MKKALRPAGLWAASDLKQWRHDCGFTQIEAATALGVTLRAIESWERGTRSPAYPALVQKAMKAAKSRRKA